jgi:uncharacterized protein (DUF2147 family)
MVAMGRRYQQAYPVALDPAPGDPTMRTLIALTLLALPLLSAAPARADDAAAPTPVGKWRTIDDKTGKPKSIVAISEEDGKLIGTIEKLLDPKPDDPEPKCTKCEGERKDQPILGMKILWGMKKEGKEWGGGRILDPNNGKTYKCNLALADEGKKLDVRGYIGMPLLGRTQTWIREE